MNEKTTTETGSRARPGGPTPAEVWRRLRDGNARFAAGSPEHPSQAPGRRAALAAEQHPWAVVLGCSDSRVPPELVFDAGLGDLFVVRTAGHVLDPSVTGSVEFGVDVLGAPLVLVLGHVGCGAVAAAERAVRTGLMPAGTVRAVVDRVVPAMLSRADLGGPADPAAPVEADRLVLPDIGTLRRNNVRSTMQLLLQSSGVLAQAVGDGRCAVVGAEYDVADGTVGLVDSVGPVGEPAS